jgi:hypothetical protein
MATETAEVPVANAKSDSRSGNWHTWLSRLSLPAIMLVAYSYIHHVGIVVASLVLIVSVVFILRRSPSRRVMYACSLAVLLFAGVFTLGIVGDTKSVPSAVTGMWSQGGFGPEEYGVSVTCDEAGGGKLMAVIRKGDFNRMLGQEWNENNQYPVELTYRTQSILGILSLPPVADAIDSRLVISDYREYLRGGITGRVVSPLTLVLGALSLSYLVYKDRKNLFGKRSCN